MERNVVTWPLVSVQHYKNVIDPTPKYQRYAVWTRAQQQLLMDSVFRGYDIPKLYLRELEGAGPFKYEAVDGQQRLRAVWEFFEGQYTLNTKFTPTQGGKKYAALDMGTRMVFDHYQFNVVILKNAEESEIRDMFCRLQNGKPLNSAEKRNAMMSAIRDFCAELADHTFFKESVSFGNKRMEHQHVAAQTALIEIRGGPASCGAQALERLYKEQDAFSSNGSTGKKIKKIYNFLVKCFPDKTPELKRGMVVSLYLLISELMKSYSINGKEDDIHNFLIEFDHNRRTHTDDVDMVTFTSLMSRQSDSEDAIRKRHGIMLRAVHGFCPRANASKSP